MKTTLREFSEKTKSELYSPAEIRSGLLVLVSLIVFLVFLFLAGGSGFFKRPTRVRILFSYISGLAKNAPVHFAGHQVGKVTDIRLVGKNDGQIAVIASLSKEAVLRKDSQAYVDMLGFMGEKFLELTPGTPEAAVLQENETLQGTDPVALNEIMKKGSETAEELRKTTIALEGLIENVNQTLGENRAELDGIFKNLNEASQNLKELTHDLKLHPWKLLNRGDGRKRRFLFF